MPVLRLKMSWEHTLHSYWTAQFPLLLCLLSRWVGPSLPLQMQSSACWAVRLPVRASVSLAGRPTVHSNLVTVIGFEYISGNNIVLGNLQLLLFYTLLGNRSGFWALHHFYLIGRSLVILKYKDLTVKTSHIFWAMFFLFAASLNL